MPKEVSFPKHRWHQGGQVPASLSSCFLQIMVPALMVTAEKDFVLRPELTKNMEKWVREEPCTVGIRVSKEESTGAQKGGSRGRHPHEAGQASAKPLS